MHQLFPLTALAVPLILAASAPPLVARSDPAAAGEATSTGVEDARSRQEGETGRSPAAAEEAFEKAQRIREIAGKEFERTPPQPSDRQSRLGEDDSRGRGLPPVVKVDRKPANSPGKTPVRRVQPNGLKIAKSGRTASPPAPKAGSAGRTAGRMARVAGKVAVVDAAFRAGDVLAAEQRYRRGKITYKKRETLHAKNAAGFVGGTAGAAAGLEGGAMGGAAVGTLICPGPGTAIGGAVGGTVGAVGGYFGGEAAAEYVAEKTVRTLHRSGRSIRGAWRYCTSW